MITIDGYESFEQWRSLGYPGAKSFPPNAGVMGDPRRGLCSYPGCDNVVAAYGSLTLELCGKHYDLFRNDHTPTVRAWPQLSDAVRIAREKAR